MWDRSRETDILLLLLSWISLAMQGSGYCTETVASLFLSYPSSALSFLVTCLQSIFLSHFLFSSLFVHLFLSISILSQGNGGLVSSVHSALSSPWPWKRGTRRAVAVFGTRLLWLVGAKASAGIHPAWRLQCRLQKLTVHGVITWKAIKNRFIDVLLLLI